MINDSYIFPLSIQITLPKDYKIDNDFKGTLKLLRELGFTGVELNIADPLHTATGELQQFLADFGLTMTMFASGLMAKVYSLSLSHAQVEVRKKSIEYCLEAIEFAAHFNAGVIVGFLKGDNSQAPESAKEYFQGSLNEIAQQLGDNDVSLLIEATNRYESSVANTVEGTVDLVRTIESQFIQVLPDTFHMNVEESDMFETLEKNTRYINSIHLSDNNRFFPGFGAIDFVKLIRFLKKINYRGGLAIEGNIKTNFVDDIKKSMKYLTPILTPDN